MPTGSPFFETPEELQEKVDSYFKECPDKKTIVAGDKIIEVPNPIISGLAYYLGFESRQSFYDYEKRDAFSYTIKRARLRIEMQYELNLSFANCTGSIFALKQFDWKDKQEVEHSGDITSTDKKEIVYVSQAIKEKSPEERKKLYDLLEGRNGNGVPK